MSEEGALQDLEALLRKSINDQVTVVNFKTSNLLPPGENYGSLMLKVDAVIKRSKDSDDEELNLVAKLIPKTQMMTFLKTAITFGKEIFLFEKLEPCYRQIEQDNDLGEDGLKDAFPKYYGGRLIEDKENPGRALENAVLLLKNIKLDGYGNVDRRKGLDLTHAKLALSELARFHGLNMAVRKYKPDLFAEANKIMAELPFEMESLEVEKFVGQIFSLLSQDPRTAKYLDRIQESVKGLDWKTLMTAEPVEPWVTISHGDFWVNNMMFREGEDGSIDVKLIDFQTMRVSSPVNDLPYFFFASTSPEVLKDHFEELLDLYYDKLIEVLKKTGCDASSCTRESFDAEMDQVAKLDLFRCITAVKFITFDQSEVAKIDMNDIFSVVGSAGSQLYFDRISDILSKYVEKGWL